ncbi:S66 peptidase family protein [Phytoactinopolyspora halotolerans]|uniref:LD-carboxypeptidase n=1 Tax=Phytoactinopolyspora halotolerans TaxID=1981512 RepID=A0A6L9S1C1_9ACTN|nr:LD-carboxypeptidase [Phytoactinopolyspora halotolerans]NED98778.1 LD-carboxypeptidase [Phytoactinopolyspora halotolerans]
MVAADGLTEFRQSTTRLPPASDDVLTWPRLEAGDRVRFVSPASPPSREHVDQMVELLTGWGLRPEIGDHAFDQVGYLAGTDEQRLADLDDAFRDPGVRAVFATRGGKGAYRISHQMDFAAVRRDPKPLIGFSDITIMHMALWKFCRLGGVHGYAGAERTRHALMTTDPIVICADPDALSAATTTAGTATGFLLGGNLGTVRTSLGCELPSLDGAIWLVEDLMGTGLGEIDRELTQLLKSGALDGVRGVAVGHFTGFEATHEDETLGGWTVVDVLNERLSHLGVPVLGGLPLGHGDKAWSVPLGEIATIDAGAGTLTVRPVFR